MAGSSSGCYSGQIENGFVATTSCRSYSSRAYCRYYCHDGYVKTATTVYCAGNDKWIPSGSHPSERSVACRKETDQVRGCDNRFINNGYLVTCSTLLGGRTDCMYRCFQGYKQASTSVTCVRNEWLTSDTYSQPCIKDETFVKPTAMTRRPTMSTAKTVRTTYPGYYDDPNLKMNVNPVVFVGAVIGGLLVLGLLIFTIFFRAHRKSTRETRTRSAFIAACDPLSLQNDYTNNNADIPVDDSQYRDIARRIMSQSQRQQDSSSPPPYETNSSSLYPDVQNVFLPPASTPYQDRQFPVNENYDIFNGPPSPPYSVVNNSGPRNVDASLRATNDDRNNYQTERTSGFPQINTPTDNPPSYEDVQNENVLKRNDKNLNERPANGITLDPPPPYTSNDGENEL